MKHYAPKILMLALVSILFTSCELIGDIFQAGMSVGIFLVIAVIVLIIFVVSKFRS